MECYVDDIAVKSRDKGDHLADLKKVFDIIRAHQLKMNPTKSFLGVASGKFLGFVVTSKGINLDPEKIRAIQEMQPLRSLKELVGLQGHLAYTRRYIKSIRMFVTARSHGYGDVTATYMRRAEIPHIYTLSISAGKNQSTKAQW